MNEEEQLRWIVGLKGTQEEVKEAQKIRDFYGIPGRIEIILTGPDKGLWLFKEIQPKDGDI